MFHPALNPPMLTADLPGIGGRIRVTPEDFEVEEIPSYEPCGSGDHLYLWIEKRGIGPEFLAKMIAQRLQVPVRDIGIAGLKDRHAVTRQWVSVPAQAEAKLTHLNTEGLTLLRHDRHTNKLKTGHLKGNTFTIVIRNCDTTRKAEAAEILNRLHNQGLPNYYGPQRFGRGGSTLDLGFQCLHGKQSRRVRPFQYRFALSAVQSLLFNDYLAHRIADGFFRTALSGDVMAKTDTCGLFVVEDVAEAQERFDRDAILPCGPMFGKHTYASAGVAAEREQAILSAHDLSPESFANFGKLMGGTRRNNLVLLKELQYEWIENSLKLRFTLPSGSYATVLLREIMKMEEMDSPAESTEGEDDE